MEKQKKMQSDIQENQIYAHLWKLDQLKKEEREKKEQEEKKKRVGDTMAVLDWQKDVRNLNQDQQKALIEQEKGMLKNQWKSEEEY